MLVDVLGKYVKAAIENLEYNLVKSDTNLPKCCTPMSTRYHPSEDVTKELNVEGVQFYQELIGIIRREVEIIRVDILLEVSLLLSQLDLPKHLTPTGCISHIRLLEASAEEEAVL